MKTIDDYLDAAKARLGVTADRRLAHALEIDPINVSDYRQRKTWPSDATMLKIAAAADVDPGIALLDLNAWRTKSGPAQAIYQRARDLLAKSAAAVLVVLAVGAFAPDASAASSAPAASNGASPYIMRNILAMLRRWLGRMVPGFTAALWPRLAHAATELTMHDAFWMFVAICMTTINGAIFIHWVTRKRKPRP